MKFSKKFFTGLYLFLAGITILITIHFKKSDKIIISDMYTIGQTGSVFVESEIGVGFNSFDTDFLNFIGEIRGNGNFMISPISFKVALAMLTIGASGDTQKKLLDTIGYDTSDDYLNWAINLKTLAEENSKKINELNKQQERYNEGDNEEQVGDGKDSFIIANSIWHNSNQDGKFTEQYKQNIAKIGGIFGEIPGEKLDSEINNWVTKYTNGLIPSLISQPIPDVNTVLVNTTYLKSSRTKQFEKNNTKPGDFITIDGKSVQKDFMHKSDTYLYYEDKDCQVLTMYLYGGFAATFVLGDSSNILEKIKNSTSENVEVTLPKFELETSLDEKELVTFLENKGLGELFDPNIGGDFSNMIEDIPLYVDDIIQKTKIMLDENGLEAAAATVIAYKMSLSETTKVKYKKFTANKPFKFYIYTNDNEILEPQLLFYGQILE